MSINDKVSQALQWLEDEGWSDLIDSRWTLEVYDELQKSGLGLTDEDIRKTLDIVIFDKPDYNPANNKRHKTKSETHPNIRKIVFWDIDMNTINYKGFMGSVNFSEKDNVFFGKIEGIDGLVNFEGESVTELTNAFHEAVEDYIAYCTEEGLPLPRPAKGVFFASKTRK